MRGGALLIVVAACTSSSDAPKKQSGYVSLASWQYDSGSQVGRATARFFSAEFPAIVSASDPCERDQYTAISDDTFDAGVITVSGTHPGFTLAPDATDHYPQYVAPTQTLYSGGEALTIAASGGTVPAFTEQLVAPSKIAVTSPVPPSSGVLTIPIGQDLAVQWTGGSGLVQVTLRDPPTSDTLICRFPASAGSGVVPAAVLAQVGQHGADAQMQIDTVDFARVSVGDWRVDVSATFVGRWSNGNDAAASIAH